MIKCESEIEGLVPSGPCVQIAPPAPLCISSTVDSLVNQGGIDFNGFGLPIPYFLCLEDGSLVRPSSVVGLRGLGRAMP